MGYRRRASPLHAARAGVAALYCVTLAAVALSFEHPLVLATLLVAVLGAAWSARVAGPVLRALVWALPFAVLIAFINPFVQRDGLTVIARLGEIPPFGQIDLTLEATVYGGILGARAVVVILCFALFTCTVDPDALLGGLRRLGLRSALTAALATRLIGVLARDARRLHLAQRCLPEPASRVAVLRAVTANALDRAVDVAATLEVRGYASPHRGGGVEHPWSRHDLAFGAAAVALAALAMVAAAAGWEPFEAYPSIHAPVTGAIAALSGALAALALAPFADRRGVR